MKISAKLIFQNLIILILFSLIFLYIFGPSQKREMFEIYKNRKFTVGKYYEKDVKARGATQAKYKFKANGKFFYDNVTRASFSDSNPTVNRDYIVVYNSNNPKQSIMFLNLKVSDSLKDRINNEDKKLIYKNRFKEEIDYFFYESLITGLSKYFPPYYDQEDLPELEYLMED